MSNSKKRRKSRALQKLIVFAIVLVIIIFVGFFCVYKPLREKAVSTAATQLIESQLPSDTLSEEEISALLDSMDPEDRAAVEYMSSSHISFRTISDLLPYLSGKDMAGLREYAKNVLTDEELAQLQEIYEKYQDEVDAYLK